MRIADDVRCLVRKAIEDHNIDDEECYNLICSIIQVVAATAEANGAAYALKNVIETKIKND